MRLALVGDIGGTNARFALWRNARLEAVRVLATADFATPELAVEYYGVARSCAGQRRCGLPACAGPVRASSSCSPTTTGGWGAGISVVPCS